MDGQTIAIFITIALGFCIKCCKLLTLHAGFDLMFARMILAAEYFQNSLESKSLFYLQLSAVSLFSKKIDTGLMSSLSILGELTELRLVLSDLLLKR